MRIRICSYPSILDYSWLTKHFKSRQNLRSRHRRNSPRPVNPGASSALARTSTRIGITGNNKGAWTSAS